MSGIYIKGMEMPDRCEACPFFVRNIHDRGDDSLCLASGEEAKLGCPLIPVPEHGRLVDADALEDHVLALKADAVRAYEWSGESRGWDTRIIERGRFAVLVEDAPTVIPADEEGET